MFHDRPLSALDAYQVVYHGGDPDLPEAEAGELVLTADGLRFVPACGTASFWQPTVWIAYHSVSGTGIEAHDFLISYLDRTGARRLVRFEMVSGDTVPGRVAKCRQLEDRLRTLSVRDRARRARSADRRDWTVELAVIRMRMNDNWRAVAVIDGRDYADRAQFRRVLDAAFETLADYPAEIETSRVDPEEPPSGLPNWADYRATLGDRPGSE